MNIADSMASKGSASPEKGGFAASAPSTGSERGAYGCDPVAVWALLEASDGSQILLRQRFRPGGGPSLDGSWEAAAAGVDDAHYRHSDDAVLSLLWCAGDIVALLQADAASLAELVHIAESASLVPGRSR